MKFSMFIIFAFFVGPMTFAEMTPLELKSIQDQIQRATGKRDKGVEQVKLYGAKLAKIQKDIEDCKTKKTWRYCEEAGQSEAELKRFEKETQNLITDWGKDITDANTVLVPLIAKMEAEQKRKTDEVMGIVRQNRTELQSDFNNLKFERANLGRDIDKMAVGQYVAAKMGLMLNSQAFCDAKARCDEPKGVASEKNKVNGTKLREQIFPGGPTDMFNGTDFWQESRATTKAPGTK